MSHDSTPATVLGRRHFIQALSGGLACTIPGWSMAANGLLMPTDDLPLTPAQTEGPFYPETAIEQQLFNDTDLSQKMAGHEFAKGQLVVVNGVVTDQRGKPLAGSIVEVWQACATGRYHHSRDESNPLLLDNNFQFWGRAITGEDGKYSFKTIIPGMYPGRTARHIHYRVDSPQQKRLVTQCYFSEFGNDNAKDGIYRQLDAKQREQVTVQLEKPSDVTQPWSGSFNIVTAKA
jgi:protocatechuate 3,4-dioxygenase beta subunit